MIAACPKCQTRYRVDPERLGPDGARLRCARCSAVFRVRLLGDPAAKASSITAEAAATGSVPASPAAPDSSLATSRRPVAPPPDHGRAEEQPRFDRERLVLVAHPDPEACKELAEALEREGFEVLVAHDGVEAILGIQRALPRAVVLEAALPKMFGFQVCELMKRNESLRGIHVCLIGAIHNEERYRRAPSELYGADYYVEPLELPGALLDWLARTGVGPRAVRRDLPESEPPPEPGCAEMPPPAAERRETEAAPDVPPVPVEEAASGHTTALPQHAPERGPAAARGGDELAAARAQAERLARIIVSDIVLYNEKKFEAALRSDNVVDSMRDELDEGRALFRERIDARVRDERDFLADELLRTARARGVS